MIEQNLMTIIDAQAIARELGQEIPGRTIRYACKNGFIDGAMKLGRDWTLTKDAFIDWLLDRPKPGRK